MILDQRILVYHQTYVLRCDWSVCITWPVYCYFTIIYYFIRENKVFVYAYKLSHGIELLAWIVLSSSWKWISIDSSTCCLSPWVTFFEPPPPLEMTSFVNAPYMDRFQCENTSQWLVQCVTAKLRTDEIWNGRKSALKGHLSANSVRENKVR